MYSKAEAFHIKKEFWTAFGMYMKPVKNSEGNTVNWINYKTGFRHIYFRMDVDKNKASLAIEMKHPVTADRLKFFNKLQSLKSYFKEQLRENWHWQQVFYDDDGTEASRVFISLEGVNIFNKNDWPSVISFFKERMIKLDMFWNDVKFQFET